MRTAKSLVTWILAAGAIACGSCSAPRLQPIDPGPSPPTPPREIEELPPMPATHREIGKLPDTERPGEDAEFVIEARGFEDAADIFRAHEALAAVPGVHLARHEGTALEEGAPAGTYRIFFHGDPEKFAALAAETRWRSGARSVRLRRGEGFRFRAVYE